MGQWFLPYTDDLTKSSFHLIGGRFALRLPNYYFIEMYNLFLVYFVFPLAIKSVIKCKMLSINILNIINSSFQAISISILNGEVISIILIFDKMALSTFHPKGRYENRTYLEDKNNKHELLTNQMSM